MVWHGQSIQVGRNDMHAWWVSCVSFFYFLSWLLNFDTAHVFCFCHNLHVREKNGYLQTPFILFLVYFIYCAINHRCGVLCCRGIWLFIYGSEQVPNKVRITPPQYLSTAHVPMVLWVWKTSMYRNHLSAVRLVLRRTACLELEPRTIAKRQQEEAAIDMGAFPFGFPLQVQG